LSVRRTALGALLQQSREAAGYSRTRVGDLVGIKPTTIESWELGRVARPPLHDVLRLAHFLRIPTDAIQQAVFADAGEVPAPPAERDRPRETAIPLLEAAFRLFAWPDNSAAAAALRAEPDEVARWRSGSEQMPFADYLTLTSLIGVAAAEAVNGDQARIADLDAAADQLGLSRLA
jgi:transcriptional regulator with XRE-family HTH domain